MTTIYDDAPGLQPPVRSAVQEQCDAEFDPWAFIKFAWALTATVGAMFGIIIGIGLLLDVIAKVLGG